MVAFDALEQMHAEAFELIAADAAGDRIACGIEIGVEKFLGEIAHGQPRRLDMPEQHVSIPRDRDA